MISIGVIGCGNVGFAFLSWLIKRGFSAFGFDTSKTAINRIGSLLGKNHCLKSFNDLRNCDCIFICVPTEPNADGTVDMSIFESVINNLADLLNNSRRPISIIQRSTCPPGSAQYYQTKFDDYISYGVNPSFLRKASIQFDTENPDRIAYGGGELACKHLECIYDSMPGSRFVSKNTTCIELLKYVENTLDAILISYWNEIALYAASVGLTKGDFIQILERIGDRDKFKTVSRIPGKAFGLSCLPKDLSGLIEEMKQVQSTSFTLGGAQDTNRYMMQKYGESEVPANELFSMKGMSFQVEKQGEVQLSQMFDKSL